MVFSMYLFKLVAAFCIVSRFGFGYSGDAFGSKYNDRATSPELSERLDNDVRKVVKEGTITINKNNPSPGVLFERAYYTTLADGGVHFRRGIRRHDGVVKGSYGITFPKDRRRIVYYLADKNGAKYWIKSNEPGAASVSGSTGSTIYSKVTDDDVDAISDVDKPFEQIFQEQTGTVDGSLSFGYRTQELDETSGEEYRHGEYAKPDGLSTVKTSGDVHFDDQRITDPANGHGFSEVWRKGTTGDDTYFKDEERYSDQSGYDLRDNLSEVANNKRSSAWSRRSVSYSSHSDNPDYRNLAIGKSESAAGSNGRRPIADYSLLRTQVDGERQSETASGSGNIDLNGVGNDANLRDSVGPYQSENYADFEQPVDGYQTSGRSINTRSMNHPRRVVYLIRNLHSNNHIKFNRGDGNDGETMTKGNLLQTQTAQKGNAGGDNREEHQNIPPEQRFQFGRGQLLGPSFRSSENPSGQVPLRRKYSRKVVVQKLKQARESKCTCEN